MEKAGRNDPCPCGSGKKFKKCCELKKNAPKKINAQVLQSGDALTGKVHGLSRLFQRPAPSEKTPIPEEKHGNS